MRSTFKIMFYINRQKIKADGNTAILCRITIDGKSTTITTGEECNPSEWNTKQGLTTGLIALVLDIGKQCFPFIAVKPLYQPNGFGQ